MDYQKKLNMVLFEADTAAKEVLKLIKGDKEATKKRKNDDVVEYLDYVYLKYEKELESIMKKYKLDYDDIAGLLVKK